MPDPVKILNTIRLATEHVRSSPGRRGAVVWLEDADEVMVVGDLHGNLSTFRQVLEAAGLADHPGRHLVLQELVHGRSSYPDDGGDRSHQLVDLVCALKCQYPDRVHLILGNHELAEMTGRPIAKGGESLNAHFRKGIQTAYGTMAGPINAAYLRLFAALPMAVRTPNRVFMGHTIPDADDLDRLDLGLLRDGTWPPEAMARGGTIYALTWGRDTSPETADRFAAMIDADLFLTGHQPQKEGFCRANHRLIILDAAGMNPAYCLFPARAPLTIDSLLSGVRVLSLRA